jgi:ribosomal protein S18 acetylase RimI-like enzyme
VADRRGEIAGFVSGSIDPMGFYRTMFARKWRLALAAAPSLLGHPWLMGGLLWRMLLLKCLKRASRRFGPRACELASLGVAPEHARRGWGKQLVQEFVRSARDKNATQVYLDTNTRGNDIVHRLYRELGFQFVRTFRAGPRRFKTEYVLSLESHGAKAEAA